MAYYDQRPAGVRVQVEIDGSRRSRTFATRELAEAWAAVEERRLRAKRTARRALAEHGLGSAMPRRMMQARSLLPLDVEHIVSTSLPRVTLCGIYFLIRGSEVVYVGQSVDVWNRLSRHLKGGRITFDSFNVVPCAAEDMDGLEAAYITALIPEHNRRLGETALPELPQAHSYRTNAEDAAAHGGAPWWKRSVN